MTSPAATDNVQSAVDVQAIIQAEQQLFVARDIAERQFRQDWSRMQTSYLRFKEACRKLRLAQRRTCEVLSATQACSYALPPPPATSPQNHVRIPFPPATLSNSCAGLQDHAARYSSSRRRGAGRRQNRLSPPAIGGIMVGYPTRGGGVRSVSHSQILGSARISSLSALIRQSDIPKYVLPV
jgi:hypothetical protein